MYATLTFHNHEQSLHTDQKHKMPSYSKVDWWVTERGFFLSKVCAYFVLFPDFTVQYSFYDLIKT